MIWEKREEPKRGLTSFRDQRTISIRVAGVSSTTNARCQVIYHLTLGVLRTHTLTRIDTFISNACSVWGAIGVQCTFWSATFVWISEIVRKTLAWASAILFDASSIGTARARIAWVNVIELKRGLFDSTLIERISNIATQAFANRGMANGMTFCVQPTDVIRTRISAMPIYASHIVRAFRVRYAFRSTIRRISNEISQATTCVADVSLRATFCVIATRRTHARIEIDWLIMWLWRLFNFWE